MSGDELTDAGIRRRLDTLYDGGPVCAADRRYALELCGVSCAEVAEEAGTWHSVVSETLSGRRIGRRVRQVVAQRLEIPEERLWPEVAA